MRASRGLSFTSAIAVGLGAVLLLGACTPEETEPTPSASPTVEEPTHTPTPTTPPEAIAPERPDQMAEISVAGAEAAAAYFLQLYPYVYATGDLTEWSAISNPECAFCASVTGNVQAQLASGNSSEGGLITITEISATKVSDEYYTVRADIKQSAGTERAPDGSIVDESLPSTATMAIALIPTLQGTWSVRAVEVDPEED